MRCDRCQKSNPKIGIIVDDFLGYLKLKIAAIPSHAVSIVLSVDTDQNWPDGRVCGRDIAE